MWVEHEFYRHRNYVQSQPLPLLWAKHLTVAQCPHDSNGHNGKTHGILWGLNEVMLLLALLLAQISVQQVLVIITNKWWWWLMSTMTSSTHAIVSAVYGLHLFWSHSTQPIPAIKYFESAPWMRVPWSREELHLIFKVSDSWKMSWRSWS